MASLPLTEDDVAKIIAASKEIAGDLVWRYDPQEGFAKAEARVANSLRRDLRVYASASLRIPGRFSFSLVASGAFSVRRLDSQKRHKNRHTDNRLIGGSHFHIWTNRCRDRWADVPPFAVPADVSEAFAEFCKVCNIEFAGKVHPLPVQQGELL